MNVKKVLMPVGGLLFGLLGGTAWTVATHPAEPDAMAADSALVADSAGGVGGGAAVAGEVATHEGEAAASMPTGDHAAGAGDPATAGHTVPTSPVQVVQAASRPGTAPRTRPADGAEAAGSSATDEGAAQLARIFSAMQARDAANVLTHLNDAEIQEILTRMAARQAAAVLSNMDPDRAAILSRAVLGDEGGQ